MTMVRPASKMHDGGLPTMSVETIGSSVYSQDALQRASAAALIAALTSSLVACARRARR